MRAKYAGHCGDKVFGLMSIRRLNQPLNLSNPQPLNPKPLTPKAQGVCLTEFAVLWQDHKSCRSLGLRVAASLPF